MKIQKILILLLLGTLLANCSNPEAQNEAGEAEATDTAPTTFTLPDGRKQDDTLRRVETLKIERPRENVQTYLLDEKPYNGSAIHFAQDDRGFLEYRISEGQMVRMYGYYADGGLERNFTFKEGKSHGTLIMYYPDGKKYIEENYNMGQLEGPQSRWHKNGKLWRSATYEEGKLVKETLYTKKGEELSGE